MTSVAAWVNQSQQLVEAADAQERQRQKERRLQAEERGRRARRTAAVLGVAFLIATAFGVYASFQKVEAERQRSEREKANKAKWGIYLTQVTPRCSMACRGGLSKKSGRIRGALFDGGILPRVSGSVAVAGWFSVSAVWWAEDLAGARSAAAVWGLRIPELGDGWDNLPGHA